MIPFKEIFYLFEKKEKPKVILLIIMIFFGACLETIGIGLILPFISLINDPSLLDNYKIVSNLYEITGSTSFNDFLILCGLSLLLFYLAKNAYLTLLLWTKNRFIFKEMHALALRLFAAYMKAPYVFHLRRNSSELQRNINNYVLNVFNYVFTSTLFLVGDVLVLLTMLVLLLFIDPFSTILAGSVLVLASAAFFQIISKKIQMLGDLEHKHVGQMFKWVNQGLASVKETKLLGSENYFLGEYGRSCGEYVRAKRFVNTVREMPRYFLEMLAVVGMLTIIFIFLLQGRDIQTVIPLIAVFAAAAFRLIPATNRIISSVTVIKHLRPMLEAVVSDLKIFEEEPGEQPISSTPSRETGQRDHQPFRDSLVLDKIFYRYPGSQEEVLHGVSLNIRRGQSVAFVGPSGSGKTTAVDIILGLLMPTGGKVLVDGRDIMENLHGWQRLFGYIPQSIYLMDDTIRRNIAFAVKDDMIDEEAVWEALRSAQLDEFITELPDKLDTYVGEDGVRLSGGQRQRIGIARALYHDPDILVLDEATSSLDNETERAISDAISGLSGDKTILIIAHRLSTIKHCDHIFFIKDGRLVDSGDFSYLIKASKDFQEMAGIT